MDDSRKNDTLVLAWEAKLVEAVRDKATFLAPDENNEGARHFGPDDVVEFAVCALMELLPSSQRAEVLSRVDEHLRTGSTDPADPVEASNP